MKVFYHSDLDGRASAAVIAAFINNYDKDDYFEVAYIDSLPLDKISDGESVFFVDYSFKKDTVWVLQNLLEKNCDIIWIDHHTSSIELEKSMPELKEIKGIRSDEYSGAVLTQMYIHNWEYNDCDYFIKLVDDYDCWKYNLEPYTTFFKLGLDTYKYDALDKVWVDLLDEDFDTWKSIMDKGGIIKGYVDEDNVQYRDSFAYESEICGNKCLVVNKRSNSWIFGDKYNDYPLVMVWVFNGEFYSYSIFSSNADIDCSKIAESYGGGGHKGAAGFKSTELLFKKVGM